MRLIYLRKWTYRVSCLLALGIPALAANTVLSLSAYRALGQPDLRQNAVNMAAAATLYAPQGVAVDASGHLYVADTGNHRVLAWESLSSFQNGAAADLVLGQQSFTQTIANGIGAKGLTAPGNLAVHPLTSDLYVADVGNSRVVRFPHPFANPANYQPDAVYGQPNFTQRAPNVGGITAKTTSFPRGLGFDSKGNLWVVDTGNNRVIRFPNAVLDTTDPAADLVLGQNNFTSGMHDRGAGPISAEDFDAPTALTFDAKDNLYVADFLNARILEFTAPISSNATAAYVWGQPKFTTRILPVMPSTSSLAGPTGVAVDAAGNVYAVVPGDNRIMVYAPTAVSGAAAFRQIGQQGFATRDLNSGSFPLASATSLAFPQSIALDSQGNLLVADAGNNRVLFIPAKTGSASRVLGQSTFWANGVNEVKPGSINSPYGIAVDYSKSPFALYVSDTNNNRVLVWKDAAHFRSGQSADLVIGQPNLGTAASNVDGGVSQKPSSTGLAAPTGIAVTSSGDLYVADTGNNRVLHYPRPVDQSGRITPDVVLGQSDFTSNGKSTANAGSLVAPVGLAVGSNGDLFVADSGNSRVLEFPAGAATGSAAIRVYGQVSFTAAGAPGADSISAETLSAPEGLAVDKSSNLYVADAGANRVLIYSNTSGAPQAGLPASIVLGQADFGHATAGKGATGLHTPVNVALDSGGNIFVSDAANNRVVVYPSLANLLVAVGPPFSAYEAFGQPSLTSVAANYNSRDGLATPEGLGGPVALFVDRQDTLYVGDTGNSRVVHYLKKVSVTNAATGSTSAPVGQGSWCTLLGASLASKSGKAKSSGALPMSLANRTLAVNDSLPVPLSSVSATQIQLVLPAKTPLGVQRIASRTADTGELVAGGPFVVAEFAPGLYTVNQQGTGQAVALNEDGSSNSSSHPAAYGSTVRIFGTGQGPVTTPVPDGQPAPSSPDDTVAKPTSNGDTCLVSHSYVCVALGGSGGGAAFADVKYSGLAPGQVGTWELKFTLPATGLLGNTVIVRAVIGGINLSNAVTLSVK